MSASFSFIREILFSMTGFPPVRIIMVAVLLFNQLLFSESVMRIYSFPALTNRGLQLSFSSLILNPRTALCLITSGGMVV